MKYSKQLETHLTEKSKDLKDTFTAIDFETACYNSNSICQIGLVRVFEGIITDEICLLVQPPENIYRRQFTEEIHGIGPKDTIYSPTFDKVWPQIEPYITEKTVAAHNGFGFDFQVLETTLDYYGLNTPPYEKKCTYRIFQAGLAALCKHFSIPLNHHDALSDARACAKLYLIHLSR